MVRRRPAVILMRDGREDQGFFYSPYTGRVYDLRGVPPGGLTRDVDTGVAFSAGHSKDAAPRRIECFQRACARSLSTSARASSVMFSNSGHGR
jgi:hypothetical protein